MSRRKRNKESRQSKRTRDGESKDTSQASKRSSRRDKFARQRFRSWMWFLGKIAMFVVPILGVTTWLIVTLLQGGKHLPILTLNYSDAENRQLDNWYRVNFSLTSNKEVDFKLPDDAREDRLPFGGPNQDVAFVFADVLGDVRKIEGEMVPCIFIANNAEQHATQAFVGQAESESLSLASQWVSLEDYLKKVLAGIDRNFVAGQSAKIVFVLDVDHPDLPTRLPPELNQFVKLCRKRWGEFESSLSSHQVFLWLSHSEGQRSYFDSDPSHVESFFKRRFELAMTGDVLEIGWDDRKKWVDYRQIRDYMKQWVETDASVHLLAQSPTFLEPASFRESDDFPVLEFNRRPEDAKEQGKLFEYRQRSQNPTLDETWGKLKNVATQRHWTIENPLLLQQATKTLMQMEQLWYRGLDKDFRLFDALELQLDGPGGIFNKQVSIEPFRHSLAEEWVSRGIAVPPPMPLQLIASEVVESAPGANDVEKIRQQRKADWAQWQQDHSNWKGELTLTAWLALADKDAALRRQTLVDLVKALEANAVQVMKEFPQETVQAVNPSSVYWNEFAFLKRLTSEDELIWPEREADQAAFAKLVHLSIQARHHANWFAAKLEAPLAVHFATDFAKLERQRRLCEDKLFAHDVADLSPLLGNLIKQFDSLQQRYEATQKEFERIQQTLRMAPYELRYAIQSTTVADHYSDIGSPFESWLTEANGYAVRWGELGGQALEAVLADSTQQPSGSLDALRSKLDQLLSNDPTRRLATSPQNDQKWLNDELTRNGDNVDFMGVTDGNLLARRILAWPDLNALELRKRIHRGLSKPDRVDPSGEANQAFPYRESQLAEKLDQLLSGNKVVIFQANDQPLQYNPNQLVEGDENFFVRAARDAHRLQVTSQANDPSSLHVTEAINDFRRRKSSLLFERVRRDLWGTPRSGSNSYVEASLKNHIDIVGFRLNQYQEAVYQDTVREIWNEGDRNQWSKRLSDIGNFVNKFQRFQWQRDEQQATNRLLAEAMGSMTEPMVFSIYPERDSVAVRPSTFDIAEAQLDTRAFRGQANRRLTIYLRGHVRDLAIIGTPNEPRLKVIPILPDRGRFSGAQLLVQRDKIGPSTGHVTFVIDCSNSMGTTLRQGTKQTSRMDRLKEDLIDFLEEISQRGDISVSLVAFGATERWRRLNVPVGPERDMKQLSRWEKVEGKDILTYRENRKPVTTRNVASLVNAINELKPYGDTPILGGIQTAIEQTREQQQNLIVLLTDGFQFNNRLRKDGESFEAQRSFDPETLYPKISNKLLDAPDLELVVYSYLSDVIGQIEKQGIESNDTQLKKYLSKDFGRMIEQEFPHREIVRRIQKIERLADRNKVKHRQEQGAPTLKKFLDDLLPRPYIEAYDEQKDLLSELINYPKKVNEPMMRKRLTAEELPVGKWRMEVKYSEPKLAANGFAKAPTPWTTPLPLTGNERLVFLYDPFRPSLTLNSGKLAGETKTGMLGKSEVVIKSVPKATRSTPEFALVASNDNQLTPAPQLAVVMLSHGADESSLLLQDFWLPPQTSSNVHRVVFPNIREDLRDTIFGDQAANLQLKMLSSIPPQLWHRLELGRGDDSQRILSEGKQLELPAEDWGKLQPVLPSNQAFRGYRFLLRRMNRRGETARYTLRIESDELPLDHWLVNVVSEEGTLDRYVVSDRRRRYTFSDDFKSKPKLIRIEHEFDVDLERLEERKLFLGIAKVDDLEDTCDFSIQEYFRER